MPGSCSVAPERDRADEHPRMCMCGLYILWLRARCVRRSCVYARKLISFCSDAVSHPGLSATR